MAQVTGEGSGGDSAAAGGGAGRVEPGTTGHGRRLFIIWLVISAIADILWQTLAAAHIPPGDLTTSAGGAQFDFNVLALGAIPVVVFVTLYVIYASVVWKAPKGESLDVSGPSVRTNLKVQTGYIGITTIVVLAAFVFGTYQLIAPMGAGGGEGPAPIWNPPQKASNVLVVQVIGQQWQWTYRYPGYGGFESNKLVLPTRTTVAFHVTSLDVIHDWWAYQIGIKADANPGSDNVAYTTTNGPGGFVVRCDELCGMWHGAMWTQAKIIQKQAFQAWAKNTERYLAPNTKLLPPFAWTYTPDANGADGGYYQDNQDPYSNVETYSVAAKEESK
ncbi:MAG: cytochrome c oxidase subunit II [Acidimicrobiales bacterium]